MGICSKVAFIACDKCIKYKCHEKNCLDNICCEGSRARLELMLNICAKRELSASKLSPAIISLPMISSSSRSPRAAADSKDVLCRPILPCVPAIPAVSAPVVSAIIDSCGGFTTKNALENSHPR